MSLVEFIKCCTKCMISIALFQQLSSQKLVSVVKISLIGNVCFIKWRFKLFSLRNMRFDIFFIYDMRIVTVLFKFQRASTAFHSNKQKKNGLHTKFTLLECPKIYVLNFMFREISPKFEKSLTLQLN